MQLFAISVSRDQAAEMKDASFSKHDDEVRCCREMTLWRSILSIFSDSADLQLPDAKTPQKLWTSNFLHNHWKSWMRCACNENCVTQQLLH